MKWRESKKETTSLLHNCLYMSVTIVFSDHDKGYQFACSRVYNLSHLNTQSRTVFPQESAWLCIITKFPSVFLRDWTYSWGKRNVTSIPITNYNKNSNYFVTRTHINSLTNSMAYETQRFNATFIRALQ